MLALIFIYNLIKRQLSSTECNRIIGNKERRFAKMKCKNCGHEIRFCCYCGLPVTEIENVKPQPSISRSLSPCREMHAIPNEEKVKTPYRTSQPIIQESKTNQIIQEAIKRTSFSITFPLPENVFAKTRKRHKKDK